MCASRAPDYYAVLGISPSATAAEVRSAYRQQALLHHPDKNPDRLQEATERFKLIAEAYSVLQDPQRRAHYDAAGTSASASASASGYSREEDVSFTVGKARDLFSEVFGAEFAAKLAQAAGGVVEKLGEVAEGAAPHLKKAAAATSSGLTKAADKCGKARVVRGTVAARLSSLADEASHVAAHKQKTEVLCRKTMEEHLRVLDDHEQTLAIVHQDRKNKRLGFWSTIKESFTGELQMAYDIADHKALAKTRELQARARAAEAAWVKANRELNHAEQQVARAQQEVEDVQQNGASLGQAAKAGAHFLGRVFG